MSDEKAPSSGAFLPAPLMYFCSGQPMHFCPGVDSERLFDNETDEPSNRARRRT